MVKGTLLFRADQRGPSALYRNLDEFLSQPRSLIPISERRSGIAAEFIRGPIPVPWVHFALTKISPLAACFGLMLWHVARLRKGTVRVTASLCRKYGIPPSSARRLLGKLESAGLIRVERQGRKAPRVSIIAAPEEK